MAIKMRHGGLGTPHRSYPSRRGVYMVWSRALPEGELQLRYGELDALVSKARSTIVEAEALIAAERHRIEEAEIERRALQRLEQKLVPVSELEDGEDDDEDDDGSNGMTPTRAIVDLVKFRPGLTRDEIFEMLKDRLETKSNDRRTLVVNILRRLVVKYERLEIVGGRYYLRGQVPRAAPRPMVAAIAQATDYSEFQAPALEEDDDLPF